MKPDGNMWGLIQFLDGRRPQAKPAEPLERPAPPDQPPRRPAISERQKANLLCQIYAEVSRVQKSPEDKPVKLEARAAVHHCSCNGNRTGIWSPFGMQELKTALSKLETRRLPARMVSPTNYSSTFRPKPWNISSTSQTPHGPKPTYPQPGAERKSSSSPRMGNLPTTPEATAQFRS